MSKKQFLSIIKELFSVLDFLHKKGIIHRDIKPSNLLLTKDRHVYLIDFDAARIMKDDLEQDTRLLSTRGYATPEQYGFSQTDERTDIYALGITLNQLMNNSTRKLRYKKIIQKCTDLDPNKRYISVRQVEQAFFHTKQNIICGSMMLLLFLLLVYFWRNIPVWHELQDFDHSLLQSENPPNQLPQSEDANNQTKQLEMENESPSYFEASSSDKELIVLPVPATPHWDGDTGIAIWGCVLTSGHDNHQKYSLKLYKRDTANTPDPYDTDYIYRRN